MLGSIERYLYVTGSLRYIPFNENASVKGISSALSWWFCQAGSAWLRAETSREVLAFSRSCPHRHRPSGRDIPDLERGAVAERPHRRNCTPGPSAGIPDRIPSPDRPTRRLPFPARDKTGSRYGTILCSSWSGRSPRTLRNSLSFVHGLPRRSILTVIESSPHGESPAQRAQNGND